MNSMYKYYAFISYSSKDIKWGKRLHMKLTQFRLPSVLCSEKKLSREPMKPIFFAPYNIQPGELSDELKSHLRASRHLIVICSPNSAQSNWVGQEIEYFCAVNDKKNVYFFIIDGEVNSSIKERDCYHPILKKLGFVEPLGVNVNEKIYSFPFVLWNRERAYIQLITKLLGVDFDVLWNHHKRWLWQKIYYWIILLLFLIAFMTSMICSYAPVDVSFTFYEQTPKNEYLPDISDIKIDISVGSYNNKMSVEDIDSTLIVYNLSRDFIGKEVVIAIRGENCVDVDTAFLLKTSNKIDIYRDMQYYGNIKFLLYNMNTDEPIPNAVLTIDGFETKSDSMGYVKCFIPIERQRQEYVIQSSNIMFVDSVIKPPFYSDSRVVLVKQMNE